MLGSNEGSNNLTLKGWPLTVGLSADIIFCIFPHCYISIFFVVFQVFGCSNIGPFGILLSRATSIKRE